MKKVLVAFSILVLFCPGSGISKDHNETPLPDSSGSLLQAVGNGIFRGYVRTAIVKGGMPTGKNSCRVLVLDSAAPGLQVADPNDSTDTIGGPGILFADYTTDTAGYYEISLPPGNYKVIFWAVNFVPRTYTFTITAGEIHEPIFSYYERDERPIKPGTAIDPWEGGPTHAFLEFDRNITRPDPVLVIEPEKFEFKDNIYTDMEKNFEVKIPSSLWTAVIGDDAQKEVNGSRIFLERAGKTAAAAVIAGTNKQNISLENLIQTYTEALGESRSIERKEMTVGPVQGISQSQVLTEGEPPTYFLTTVLGDTDYLFIIVCWTAETEKDQSLGEFNRLIQSFRMLNK